MKKAVINSSFIIGIGILSFIFFVVVATAIVFLFGGTVSIFITWGALIASLLLVYWLARRTGLIKPWIQPLLVLACIAVSVFTAGLTVDLSYDGNSYHKSGIGLLKNGWNPVYQDVNTFNSSEKNSQVLVGSVGENRNIDTAWLDHYPKAVWMFAASVYAVTGNIETGKAITLLSVLALFSISFGYIRQKLDRNKSLILSALIAFNPVVVMQAYSYMNDGLLGNLLLILFILLTMFIDKKVKIPFGNGAIYASIAVVIVLAIGIKFTGLAYAGIIAGCYWLFLMIRKDWKKVINVAVVGIVSLVVGLLLVGASSYVKNSVTNGNPLFPLAGEGKLDILTPNQPASYVDKSGIHKFFEANFSYVANYRNGEGETSPKIPFTFTIEELQALGSWVDIRQAGYGVWFGGILIVSFFVAIYLAIRYGKQYRKQLPLFVAPIICVGLTILIFPDTWWARYLPHLYIIPIIVLVALFITKHTVLPYLVICMLFFNVVLTASLVTSTQTKWTKSISASITAVECDNNPKVYSGANLDGLMYNIWDKCPRIEMMTTDQFSKIAAEKQRPLFTDQLYLGYQLVQQQ